MTRRCGGPNQGKDLYELPMPMGHPIEIQDILNQEPVSIHCGDEELIDPLIHSLARLTPADLEQVFPPLDEAERLRHAQLVEPALQPFAQMWLDAAALSGEVRPARSRQWIIWHVLEHDIHHGSEISTILGVHGLPAVELD